MARSRLKSFIATRAVPRLRRRRTTATGRDRHIIERTGNIFAQGRTDRAGIGSFAGFVLARSSGTAPDFERMVLVADTRRAEPVWVKRAEITVYRDRDGRPLPGWAAAERDGSAVSARRASG